MAVRFALLTLLSASSCSPALFVYSSAAIVRKAEIEHRKRTELRDFRSLAYAGAQLELHCRRLTIREISPTRVETTGCGKRATYVLFEEQLNIKWLREGDIVVFEPQPPEEPTAIGTCTTTQFSELKNAKVSESAIQEACGIAFAAPAPL